jgi:hypothetical protein
MDCFVATLLAMTITNVIPDGAPGMTSSLRLGGIAMHGVDP